MFKVYSDYGYERECLMREFDTLKEAREYVAEYVRDWPNDPGHIEVIRFRPDGEAITEIKI